MIFFLIWGGLVYTSYLRPIHDRNRMSKINLVAWSVGVVKKACCLMEVSGGTLESVAAVRNGYCGSKGSHLCRTFGLNYANLSVKC